MIDPNADDYAVRRVLERYYSCIDRRDWSGLAECFTEDVAATYNSHGAEKLDGLPALIERLKVVSRFFASNHVMSNTFITVDGDAAEAVTMTIAHLVRSSDPASEILVRGIRYDDGLVRRDGIWKIRRRIHMPLWQYRTETMRVGYGGGAPAATAPPS